MTRAGEVGRLEARADDRGSTVVLGASCDGVARLDVTGAMAGRESRRVMDLHGITGRVPDDRHGPPRRGSAARRGYAARSRRGSARSAWRGRSPGASACCAVGDDGDGLGQRPTSGFATTRGAPERRPVRWIERAGQLGLAVAEVGPDSRASETLMTDAAGRSLVRAVPRLR